MKILLVEDDPDVRLSTILLLNSLGCDVMDADTATGVPDMIRRHRDIDILISDVVLPGGMNGVELAVEAGKIRPDLGIVLVSGYPEVTLDTLEAPASAFLMLGKPFSISGLADALATAKRRKPVPSE